MTVDLQARLRALSPTTALLLFEVLEDLAALVWDLHEEQILQLPELQAQIDANEPPDDHTDDDAVPW